MHKLVCEGTVEERIGVVIDEKRKLADAVVGTSEAWLSELSTDELRDLVAQVRPSALAVERVLFQNNVRTAMSVGQASGIALVVAARAGVPVAQYSPNEVKLAVTGDGRADKAAVQMMVTRLLALREVPKPPDAADALALALCHIGKARLLERIPS